MGVDFDPEIVRKLQHRGLSVRFGDGEDAAFLETLPLKTTNWIVSTLPILAANRVLLDTLKKLELSSHIACVVREETHGQALRADGVTHGHQSLL
jgi:Trk K+ transport system NAD-binding subunit